MGVTETDLMEVIASRPFIWAAVYEEALNVDIEAVIGYTAGGHTKKLIVDAEGGVYMERNRPNCCTVPQTANLWQMVASTFLRGDPPCDYSDPTDRSAYQWFSSFLSEQPRTCMASHWALGLRALQK